MSEVKQICSICNISADGQHLVWVVFDNDGCECADFVGVYAKEEDAEADAQLVREFNRAACRCINREWSGSVTVEAKVVGTTDFWKLAAKGETR